MALGGPTLSCAQRGARVGGRRAFSVWAGRRIQSRAASPRRSTAVAFWFDALRDPGVPPSQDTARRHRSLGLRGLQLQGLASDLVRMQFAQVCRLADFISCHDTVHASGEHRSHLISIGSGGWSARSRVCWRTEISGHADAKGLKSVGAVGTEP